jgi:hypothetical protein
MDYFSSFVVMKLVTFQVILLRQKDVAFIICPRVYIREI